MDNWNTIQYYNTILVISWGKWNYEMSKLMNKARKNHSKWGNWSPDS